MMTDETPAAIGEIDELLSRLQEAHQALMDAIADVAPEEFERENDEGDSVRQILERSANDVNFYYGRLVAQAVSLPQPPHMKEADFGSATEAKRSLQVAHRRLSKLLHDVTAEDLKRRTRLESTGEYTLQQVLETAVAHYKLRADQIGNVRGDRRKGELNDPGDRG
jgi:hypothetical protein